MPMDPLTPQERRKAWSHVEAADPELADRLAPVLLDGDDPVISLLRTLIDQQTQAIRDTGAATAAAVDRLSARFWWVLGVVVVSMGLNAALVGVSLSLQGGGYSLSTSGAALPDMLEDSPAEPPPIPVPPRPPLDGAADGWMVDG